MRYYIEAELYSFFDLENIIKWLQDKNIKVTKCIELAEKEPTNKKR